MCTSLISGEAVSRSFNTCYVFVTSEIATAFLRFLRCHCVYFIVILRAVLTHIPSFVPGANLGMSSVRMRQNVDAAAVAVI